ncbi:MAG: purine-cytosine permease-like protein, partial [Oceanicoccus sp.]
RGTSRFELFLVMLALTLPILIIIFLGHYFHYKSEINHNILALQTQ